jgi:RNA exonuclease 1
MGRRKRKHAEFANDPSGMGNRNSTTQSTVTNDATTTGELTVSDFVTPVTTPDSQADDGGWQVSTSKKSKKKNRKSKGNQDGSIDKPSAPGLTYPNQPTEILKIRRIQDLILYVFADGVAPTWVALRNGKQIEQIVVIVVPGMEKQHLMDFASEVSGHSGDADAESKPVHKQTTTDPRAATLEVSEDGTGKPLESSVDTTRVPSDLRQCIVPIQAPGESKTGRMHNPVQTLLVVPETKSSKKRTASHINGSASVPTPITHFLHTADVFLEAEYPVHPAIFTNPKDAEWENMRREATGQNAAKGWVDTKVESSSPIPSHKIEDSKDLSGGMQVYSLDCEMVLTTDDVYSLARVSMLDWSGKVVIDRFVKPGLPVKDYFTMFSGVTEKLLEGVTTTLADIQAELSSMLTPSTILLGHSLESDFNALKMTHPFVVDTAILYPHHQGLPLRSSLKFLAWRWLKREIQKAGEDGHDSVEDAQAVLDLVKLKCEKGPNFGVTESQGESLFARLTASGKRSAIVENGIPSKGLGKLASIHVGCQDDEEITNAIVERMTATGPMDKVNFLFGQLRDLVPPKRLSSISEIEPGAEATTIEEASTAAEGTDHPSHVNGADTASSNGQALVETLPPGSQSSGSATVTNLVRIYRSLAPSTLFVVLPMFGDMTEVNRLRNQRRQYQREFKVKKWDELSVQWTDVEQQALMKATDIARRGSGLVCLK